MLASVFLSCPTPYLKAQQIFIKRLEDDLKARHLLHRTVGRTDFDMRAPLSTIRSIMLDCNGLVAVAFRRHRIDRGMEKPDSDMGVKAKKITNEWFTTPWCQIEPAMAFQIGLPVLIFREAGVRAEGILEQGVFGTYMPEFDLSVDSKADKKIDTRTVVEAKIDKYFASEEYRQVIQSWESKVWQVVWRKGSPRKLYDE